MDQKALNQYLQDRAYIEGSQPSQADRVVFEALKVLPSTEDFPHLARWFTHISSFEGKMDSFPGEAKDVAAYKAVVAKAVSSSSSSSSAPASMDPSSSETAEEKSEKQKKNDEKKKAKMEKFMAKKQKEGTSSQPKKKEEGQAEGAEAADKNPKKKKAPEVVPVDSTPKGEKKHLPAELPNSYHPKYVEAAWYDWWEKSGHFKPEKDGKLVANEKGVFVIPIPPPNVTGSLHLGHALTNSIQDALARWHRMRGETVLWNPGCDHAGIATQVVVEKKLQREQNKTRHDLGREEFVKKVWEYKEQYGGKIYNQLRRLGSSVDWDRAAFTMDEIRSRAVIEAFVRMYNMGLIYRSTRLVNWCSKLKTAISNLEVDYKELAGRELLHVTGHDPQKRYEFGVMIHFSYKVDGSDEEITVATTRIETMLGDTGIAVHPDDERYKHLHGKEVVHPFANRKFKIVPDTMVDMAFGTGAVKITPAHDPNDYEVGKRHNLPFINIFNDDGTINENGGKYQGMMRFDCRTAIIKDLEALGHFKQRVPNPMSIPVCSRTGDIIEPMIKPQWYVKINTMAKAALDCVESDELQIIPSQFKATWQRWLENPIDWCISRQLWWGHRIPAFLVKIKGRECDESNEANWVIARTPEQAMAAALEKFPDAKQEDIVLDQDPDVLDTWFSSGIFPFSIFGWPEETEEMKMFYPNTLLETGHDILFFWVARMVMMGITLTGKVPFKQVYLHAMVRDAHGRKMSKSLGNVIDPLDVIEGISLEGLHKQLEENTNLDPKEVEKAKKGQKEDFPNGIAECGTDALRFALCAYTMQARDINLDVKRVEGYRHFCNKIWNAFKFATMNLGAGYTPSQDSGLVGRSLSEKWILSRMNAAIKLCNDGFSKFTFPQATTAIYNFWLYELCDFYLELMKPVLFDTTEGKENEERKKSCKDVLYTCLDVGLRLLHPFMPFLTEELYQRLPRRPGFPSETICLAPYPEDTPAMDDTQSEEQFNKLMDAIKAIRSMRTSHYKPKDTVKVFISSSGSMEELLKSQVVAINTLCKSETEFLAAGAAPEHKCETNSLGEDCQLHLLLP